MYVIRYIGPYSRADASALLHRRIPASPGLLLGQNSGGIRHGGLRPGKRWIWRVHDTDKFYVCMVGGISSRDHESRKIWEFRSPRGGASAERDLTRTYICTKDFYVLYVSCIIIYWGQKDRRGCCGRDGDLVYEYLRMAWVVFLGFNPSR